MSRELHPEIIELLPAYALGCLDREESAEVAVHLEGCPACRAELATYGKVVGALPAAAPPASPPPALKQQVMARVQSPAHARGLAAPGAAPREGAPLPVPLLRRLMPAWTAVSLVLVLALAFGNAALWGQLEQSRRASQLANGMRSVPLQGTEAAPGAAATIVIGSDGRQGAMVVDDLPPLATGRQYQLWLIADGQRTSGGVFSVDEHGYGILWVEAPRPLKEYGAFGVTVEPNGGSPGPTGPRVLGGSL